MKRISFSRSQPWSDRLGKHTVIEIRDGAKVIGKITGYSGVGIPMMEYCVEVEGTKPITVSTLKNAKAKVLAYFGEG